MDWFGFDSILDSIIDWFYGLLYGLLKALLEVVKLFESFFDIFAGTQMVTYKDEPNFLINVFFSNNAISNAFWGMTLIAIVLAFMFCVYGVARVVTDVTSSLKLTLGKLMGNFFRCLLTLVMLSAIMVASLNISNILLDRINYVMTNADVLDEETGERTFSETEIGTMYYILDVIDAYSANPSYSNSYNINSCFNLIRGDLSSLQASGVFDYDYPVPCWQSALAKLASSADLNTELRLDEYHPEVTAAFEYIVQESKNNPNFTLVKSVALPPVSVSPEGKIPTDTLIFLISGIDAAHNSQYNTGEIDNAIRKGYLNGSKDYSDTDQVRADFNLRKMDYLIGMGVSLLFILVMAVCIFNLIVRIFNLLLLYLSAPLFVSSMPIDEGAKFQNWTQAFIIQMFSGFGMVVAMRLYLLMIPTIMSQDLVFFPGSGSWISFLNLMARVLLILGGAWAVWKSSGLISGILAGNPGMAALQQEGQTASKVLRGARMAAHGAKSAVKTAAKTPGAILKTPGKVMDLANRAADAYHEFGDKKRALAQKRINRMNAKKDHVDWEDKYKDAKNAYNDAKEAHRNGREGVEFNANGQDGNNDQPPPPPPPYN